MITSIGPAGFAKSVAIGFSNTWMGFGTGSSPPVPENVKLDNEVYRKKLGNLFHFENANFFEFYLAGDELNNVQINEVGVFFDATNAMNSGILFSRQLCSFKKMSPEIYIIRYTILYSPK
jgi:hypothetical protein